MSYWARVKRVPTVFFDITKVDDYVAGDDKQLHDKNGNLVIYNDDYLRYNNPFGDRIWINKTSTLQFRPTNK